MRRPADFQRLVLEIAAYRVDPETGWREWQTERSDRIASLASTDMSGLIDEAMYETQVDRWMRPTSWRYNQIVGWVQIIWDGPGPVLKGYLSPVVSSRSGVMPRSHYQRGFRPYPFAEGNPIHKLFEMHLFDGDSNEDFAARLRSSLLRTTERGDYLYRRHLDLESFDSISPYIDWHAALSRRCR